jgi:hypothetical protein
MSLQWIGILIVQPWKRLYRSAKYRARGKTDRDLHFLRWSSDRRTAAQQLREKSTCQPIVILAPQ